MEKRQYVRKIDDLGRIVLPRELLSSLDLQENDPLEICGEGERIVLTKTLPRCRLCGSPDALRAVEDTLLCAQCIQAIKKT